jgi:hypothetical protein
MKSFLLTIIILNINVLNGIFVQVPDLCLVAFQDASISEINKYRSKHFDTLPLQIDSTINDIAVQFSNSLAINDKLDHTDRQDIGENVYYTQMLDFDFNDPNKCASVAQLMIKSWYDEVINYDFATGKSINDQDISHFSQVVWKDTTNAGFGIAILVEETITKIYAVANFSPPGNYQNEYLNNVGPLIVTADAAGSTTSIQTSNPITFTTTTTTTPQFSSNSTSTPITNGTLFVTTMKEATTTIITTIQTITFNESAFNKTTTTPISETSNDKLKNMLILIGVIVAIIFVAISLIVISIFLGFKFYKMRK